MADSTGGLLEGGVPTIYVSDMDRSVAFYRDTLGLTLAYQFEGEYAMLDAGRGFFIGLHAAGPESPSPGGGGAIQVSFGPVGGIERVVRELEARGVEFRGPIRQDGPVRLAYFGDPDGNDLYLCEYQGG